MNYVTNYVLPHEKKSKEMGIDISKMDYPGHTVVTEKAVLLWQSRQTILKLQQGDDHN